MGEYKYKIAQSSSFKKDMKSLSADEKEEAKSVIKKLACGEELEEKYQDHQLSGKLKANVLTNLTNPINRAPCAWFRRLAVCLTQS